MGRTLRGDEAAGRVDGRHRCVKFGTMAPGTSRTGDEGRANIKMGEIMKVGSIVRSSHIAVPRDARGIVLRILGDMAMVAWFEGEPGQSKQLNTEPFFLTDLIETGEVARSAGAPLH
ncbi:hypothetical protein B0O95_102108 [Mycetohabitans endofungorum]|uniref:Uncharacterized protein n=2 Tax=Burkholderiaceae TaxID=119060 RepID=A0A2P5KDD0_9BURK|nr:hypothetical protein B0O95_102108 [Mycetohabitans endofungorum]